MDFNPAGVILSGILVVLTRIYPVDSLQLNQALHGVDEMGHSNFSFDSGYSNRLNQPCFHTVGLITKGLNSGPHFNIIIC